MNLDKAVAIVGIAGKFPGADDLEEFRELLEKGKCQSKPIPKERFDTDKYYDENRNAPGKTYVKNASLIDGFELWDHKFFNIGKKTAEKMDPQHKFALETTFRAFENGGFCLDDIRGSNTSVFMGQMNSDYQEVTTRDFQEMSPSDPIGQSKAILANQVSYTFDLRGESAALDTACSSSMIAIHRGAQTILDGSCKMSVCGGVNFILSPTTFMGLSKAGMISPKGISHSFSNKADGYGRGEGCGVVILKSIQEAKKDGDKIWGYIVTGTNQDGQAEKPITAPSGSQQEKLITTLYEKHEVKVDNIGYIEAHGTGTPVGDPVEVKALGKALGEIFPNRKETIYIGSVKSNIGHLESAAGVAGLIKLLLCMEHKKIVPSLHCEEGFNEKIPFQELNFKVPLEVVDWKCPKTGRRIGILNCFGFGGTNSHAVVMEPEPHVEEKNKEPDNTGTLQPMVVTLSAKSKEALTKTVQVFHKEVYENKGKYTFDELAWTSTCRRQHFSIPKAFVANSNEGLCQELEKWTKSPKVEEIKRDIQNIWVFCGMGTHWKGMCKELLHNEHFADNMKQIDKVFQKLSSFSIIEKIEAEEDFSSPGIGQPALFAMQVSLARLWKHWGLEPDVIVGHSVGEIAAAHIAGRLTLESAVKVIYHRGRLLEKVKGGAMLVVGNFSVEEIMKIVDNYGEKVNIAARNSSNSCTLSGDENALEEISSILKSRKDSIFVRKLDVQVAYHSKYMDPVLDEFENCLSGLESQEVKTKIISTVTGKEASEKDFCSGSYWKNNMRQSVFFDSAVTTALDPNKHNLVLEIGPRAALQSYIKDIATNLKIDFSIHPSVKPKEEWLTMQKSLGQIYEKGIKINWKNVHNGKTMTPIPIPRYQFDKQNVFVLNQRAKDFLAGKNDTNTHEHPFLRPADDKIMMKATISLTTTPFVYQHTLNGKVLMPGATYGEMFLTAAYWFWNEKYPIDKLRVGAEFLKKMTMDNDKERREFDIQVKEVLGRKDCLQCSVFCGSTEHASGMVSVIDQEKTVQNISIKSIEEKCKEDVTIESLYGCLSKVGFLYGSSLKGITKGLKSHDECIADLEIPLEIQNEVKKMTALHPVILDNILQLCMLFRDEGKSNKVLPIGIGSLVVKARVQNYMKIYMKVVSKSSSLSFYNAVLVDLQGNVIAECERIACITLSNVNPTLASAETKEYQLQWVEIPPKVEAPQVDEGEDPRKDLTAKGSYLLVSEKVGQEVALFMNSEEYKTKLLSPQCLPKEWIQNRDMIERFVETYKLKLEDMEAAIYVPKVYNFTDKNQTGEDISRKLMTLCSQLQFLLKLCQMYSKQLLIVTEFGQPLEFPTSTDEKQDSKINIYHAPLWSFVRSYLCENSSAFIKMIDIQDLQQPGDLLGELLPPYEEPEIALSQGKIYRNILRIKERKSNCHPLKRMTPLDGQSVQLKTTDVDSRHKPHLSYYQENTGSRKNQNNCFVKIQVTKAFLPVDALFPNTKESIKAENQEVWPLDGPTTFPMMGMEFHGRMLRSENEPEDVTVCCPTLVTSIIEVDTRLVILGRRLPKSKGCLWLLVLAYEILKKERKLNKKSTVLIIGDKKKEMIIEKVLKSCCEAMGVTLTCDVNEITNRSFSLVIVLPTGISNLTSVQPHLSRDTSVVILENLKCTEKVKQECWALQQFPNVSIQRVDSLEVFKPSNLSRSLPKVVNWINSSELKQFKLDIPTIDVLEGSIDDSSAENQGRMRMVTLDNTHTIPVYASEKELFSRRACYIIIGGAKGLGMVTIEQMAESGAGFILCISRNKPTPEIRENLDKLQEKWKTVIRCSSADVSDFDGLRKALQEFQESNPGIPFKGIFFGAAVLDDCVFTKMTEERFLKALRPKVVGAWNMHQLSVQMKMDLDYFVLHSSIVSILGNQGQTNYSAGNGFMDALAHYRNALGMCGQSINWGALDLGLLTTSSEAKLQLEMKGIFAIEKDEIADYFRKILLYNYSQIMIGQFNIRQLASQTNKHQPILAAKLREFIPNFSLKKETNSLNGEPKQGISVEEIRRSEFKEASAMVKKYITKVVKDIVTADMTECPDDTVFASIGLDSMGMSQMEQVIEGDMKIQVKVNPETDTLESLSQNIVEILQSETGQQQMYKMDVKPYIATPIFQEKVDPKFPEQTHQGLVIVMDLHNFPMDEEFWDSTFRILLERVAVLRTTYPKDKETNGQYMVNIYDTNTAPLKIHPNKVFDTVDDIKRYFENFVRVFDVTVELPFEIHLASSKDGGQAMILLLSFLVVENNSIGVLFQELQGIFRSKLEGKALPPRTTNLEYGNVVQYMEASRNFYKDQSLAVYREILTEIPKPLFEENIKVENDWPCNPSSVLVSTTAYHAALDICKQLKITMFQLCHGIYHLFLHAISDRDLVYCNVTVNVRAGIESLENVIGRGTGKVLVPNRIDDPEKSFESYVKELGSIIQRCKPHANFTSFEEIFEQCPDVKRTLGMLPVSTLIEMDLETRHGPKEKGAGPVKVYSPHTSLGCQMFITFVQNRNKEKLTYQLRTNRRYISYSQEEIFASSFGKIFEAVCENPKLTIKDFLRLSKGFLMSIDEDGSSGFGTGDSCENSGSSVASLGSLETDEEIREWKSFEKRSKKGTKAVLSNVQIAVNEKTREPCLLWAKRNNKRVYSMPLLSLKESYYIKENGGFSVVLEKHDRKLILESRKEKDVEELLGKINTETRNHSMRGSYVSSEISKM